MSLKISQEDSFACKNAEWSKSWNRPIFFRNENCLKRPLFWAWKDEIKYDYTWSPIRGFFCMHESTQSHGIGWKFSKFNYR